MNKKLFSKIIFTILMTVAILAIGNNVLAANENITILQKTSDEYVVYLKSAINKEFEFVYTNEILEDDAKLDYIKSAKDSKDGANVAYVDSAMYEKYFKNAENTYIWAKSGEDKLALGIKVDLKTVVTEDMVQFVTNTTKRIDVNTESKDVVVVEENGIKYTTTTGKIEIKDDENVPYYYALTNIADSKEYADLMTLAEIINKSETASTVEKLDNTKKFYDLYEKLLSEIKADKWVEVENMQVPQPKESKTGDKYVVWFKQVGASEEVKDVQFMTCYKEEDKQFITEEQVIIETSKLPITYDSIALFVVLGVAVVIFVVIFVVRKKQKDTNK